MSMHWTDGPAQYSPDGIGFEEYWGNERAVAAFENDTLQARHYGFAGHCLKCGINLDQTSVSILRSPAGCACWPECQKDLPPLFQRGAGSTPTHRAG